MAKKPQVRPEDYDVDVRKPTAPPAGRQPAGDNSDLDEGRIISAGVGITEGENRALEGLARENDTSKNSLMRLAIRLFLEAVRAGTIDLAEHFEEPERPKKRLKIGQQGKR